MTANRDPMTGDDLDPSIARQFDVIHQVPAPDVWRRVVDEHADGGSPGGGRRPAVVLVAAAVVAVVVTGVVALAYREDEPVPIANRGDDPAVTESPGTSAARTGSSVAGAPASTAPGVYGTATPEPAVVEPGGTLTVTPAAEIVPTCNRIALVSTSAASGRTPVGLLWPEGRWEPLEGVTPNTWPGCLENPTTDGITYRIPDDLADGPYVTCLAEPATDAACATFEVGASEPPITPPRAAGPGEWRPYEVRDAQASVSADGHELTLRFVAGREYSPDDPCSEDFRAEAVESDTEVRVRVSTRRPVKAPDVRGTPVAVCVDIGYSREVTARLVAPLAGRTVVVGSSERRLDVADQSTIATAGWLPDGWERWSGPEPFAGRWEQGWGPPSKGANCASAAGFILYQGPPTLLDTVDPPIADAPASTHDVHGARAEFSIGGGFPTAQLRWVENGQGLVLSSDAVCDGAEPAPLEVMLRFARNLRCLGAEPPSQSRTCAVVTPNRRIFGHNRARAPL